MLPRAHSAAFPVVLMMIVLLLGSVEAHAQSTGELERSRYNQAAFYKYAEQADVTIQINVWGAIRNPGLYEVPRGMALSRFFSIAGGPNIGDQQFGREQRLTVKLTRPNEDGDNEVVFEQEMEDAVLTFANDPVLQDGDVVTVERFTRDRFVWRDMLPVLSTVASVGSTLIILFSR